MRDIKSTAGLGLTVARSPVASAYRLGLVERPSPLVRRASDIMISDFYNDGYSIIIFTNSTAHVQRKETGIKGMLFSASYLEP